MGKLKHDMILSLAKGDSDRVATSDPLVFWKEVAHVGTFHKGAQRIDISPKHLQHWERTFGEMSRIGIKVPVPVEHTKDPERRRGEVLALKTRENSRGVPALYAKIKFRDAEAAKLSQSGASIYVPKDSQSGLGHSWRSPVEHICVTDYPVIPDLEPFSQALSLSFGAPASGEEKKDDKPSAGGDKPPQQGQGQGQGQMTLQTLAQQLGIDPSITDEQQILQAIAQMVMQLKAAGQQRPMMPPQMMPQRPPMMPAARPPMGMSLSDVLPEKVLMSLSKKQYKKLSKKLSRMTPRVNTDLPDDDDVEFSQGDDASPIALSGSVLDVVKTARKTRIADLAQKGLITANSRKQLEQEYVDGQGVAFSHQYDDGFERVVKLLENNGRVLPSGKTGPQGAIALSRGGNETENPLIADAERRAKGETNL